MCGWNIVSEKENNEMSFLACFILGLEGNESGVMKFPMWGAKRRRVWNESVPVKRFVGRGVCDLVSNGELTR